MFCVHMLFVMIWANEDRAILFSVTRWKGLLLSRMSCWIRYWRLCRSWLLWMIRLKRQCCRGRRLMMLSRSSGPNFKTTIFGLEMSHVYQFDEVSFNMCHCVTVVL